MSGTKVVSIIPGVGSESLSWAVQHSHQVKPSSSEGGSLKIYGRRGVTVSGVVRRRLASGGEYGRWTVAIVRVSAGCAVAVGRGYATAGLEGQLWSFCR